MSEGEHQVAPLVEEQDDEANQVEHGEGCADEQEGCWFGTDGHHSSIEGEGSSDQNRSGQSSPHPPCCCGASDSQRLASAGSEPDEGEQCLPHSKQVSAVQCFAAQQVLALGVVSTELGMPGVLKIVPNCRKGRYAHAGVPVIVHSRHGKGRSGVPIQSYSGHTVALPHTTKILYH